MKKGIKLFLLSGLAAFSLTCAMSCSNPTNPEKPGTEGESGTNPGENQDSGEGESGGGESDSTTDKTSEVLAFVKGNTFTQVADAANGAKKALDAGAVDTYTFDKEGKTLSIKFFGRETPIACDYTIGDKGSTVVCDFSKLFASESATAAVAEPDSASEALTQALRENQKIKYNVEMSDNGISFTNGVKADGGAALTGEVATAKLTSISMTKADPLLAHLLSGVTYKEDANSSVYEYEANSTTLTMDTNSVYNYSLDTSAKTVVINSEVGGKGYKTGAAGTAIVKITFTYSLEGSDTASPYNKITLTPTKLETKASEGTRDWTEVTVVEEGNTDDDFSKGTYGVKPNTNIVLSLQA